MKDLVFLNIFQKKNTSLHNIYISVLILMQIFNFILKGFFSSLNVLIPIPSYILCFSPFDPVCLFLRALSARLQSS